MNNSHFGDDAVCVNKKLYQLGEGPGLRKNFLTGKEGAGILADFKLF